MNEDEYEEEEHEDYWEGEAFFHVKLILAAPSQSESAQRFLEAEGTYVSGRLWIFEGGDEGLEKAAVCFDLLGFGVVPTLEGLTTDQRVKLCKRTFRFGHNLLALMTWLAEQRATWSRCSRFCSACARAVIVDGAFA